jgi:hypothetical protein
MNADEIQAKIQKEYNDFLNEPYAGHLPDWFLKKFPDVVMNMPQSIVPHRAETLEKIMNRERTSDLTYFEVGIMVNMYVAVPPRAINSNLKKFIAEKRVLEIILVEWNRVTEKKLGEMKRKTSSYAEGSRSSIVHATQMPRR